MTNKKVIKHSQITIGVATGNKTLTDALFELKILLSDLDNSKVITWIENELGGYSNKKDIPSYRKLRGTMVGTVQYITTGFMVNRQMAIPVKLDQMKWVNVEMSDNITTIEKYAKSDGNSRQIPVDLRIANSIADLEISPYCQIMSAGIMIPPSKFTDIINGVRQRILDILLLLEKAHGSLDDYSVSFGSQIERAKTAQQITKIVNNNYNYNGDKISIGDGNKIEKSAIGKENEN